jgi:hypothetical protein
LEATLGAAEFAAAVARGQAANLEEVVAQIRLSIESGL